MRPSFEEPIDTAKQMVEQNITALDMPWSTRMKEFLSQSPISEYKTIAKTVLSPKDWDEFDYYTENYIIGKGTHAQLASFLYEYELALGRWWRSTEKISGFNPYAGSLSNKKWILNEVVTVLAI